MLGLGKVKRSFSSLGKKTGGAITGLGQKIQKTGEGLGQKISGIEKKAIRGIGQGLGALGSAERAVGAGLKAVTPVLTGGRQALRIGSNIAQLIPGGQGIGTALEYGARGLNEAAQLSKDIRKANVTGRATELAGRGLERYGERKKEIARAIRQSSSNSGFM